METKEKIEFTRNEKTFLVRVLMEYAYAKKVEYDFASGDSLEERICDKERMNAEDLVKKLITYNF